MKFFVKFGKMEHLKRCVDYGLFNFSTAKKYKEIETVERIKGQGDDREATIKIKKAMNTVAIDQSGNRVTMNDVDLNILVDEAANIPVYCITEIDTDKDCFPVDGGFKIAPDIISEIHNHFPKADAALVFDIHQELIDAINRSFLHVVQGKVKYFRMPETGISLEYAQSMASEVSKESFERNADMCLMAFCFSPIEGGEKRYYLVSEEDAYRVLFCKDQFFSEEREYRFALLKTSIPGQRMELPVFGLNKDSIHLMPLYEFEKTFLFHV